MHFNENQKAHTIYILTALSSPYSVHLISWHNVWPGRTDSQKVNSEYWKYTRVGYSF